MKIISLGLDKKALNPRSPLASRLCDYGLITEKYVVFVPAESDQIVDLTDNVRVYGVGGNSKINQLFWLFCGAYSLLKVEKFSIITVQDPYYMGLVGLLLHWIFGVKLEIQIHGFEKETWLRIIIARFVIKKADLLRVVSERLKKELVKDFLVSPSKLVVIAVYSPLAEIDHPIKDYSNHKPFNFLTIGRLVPVKNITLQLLVLARLVKIFPNTQLTIVGSGPEKKNLEKLVSRLGLTNYVYFTGEIIEVCDLYEKADAFLLTSFSEGWAMVVVEAGSFGLPIIMTDVGCAGEVVVNEETGLVVPVGSESALFEGMSRVVKDQALRSKLGSNLVKKIALLPNKHQTLELYRQAWSRLV